MQDGMGKKGTELLTAALQQTVGDGNSEATLDLINFAAKLKLLMVITRKTLKTLVFRRDYSMMKLLIL
jgi:hypothetical protein